MDGVATALVGLSTHDLSQLAVLKGQPTFRVRQIASWVYGRGVGDFDEMTDLPKALRATLAESCSLARPRMIKRADSSDGSTTKFLLGLSDGQRIEAVLMQTERRDTICVSTQVGCAYGCKFCATGAMGWKRNLTPHEIISQPLIGRDELLARGGSGSFNLVFMGMGEPLANYASLVKSIGVLNEDQGRAGGRRRMTVSTVGLVPEILRLAGDPVTVRLAISLNATENAPRSKLMPVTRRFPLEKLVPAVREYGEVTGQRVTFEYVLLRGINDTRSDADRLASLARRAGCTINLIAFNAHPLSSHAPSTPDRVRDFHDRLLPIAPTVTLRESKGADIRAACGQLSTAYEESPEE